MSRGECNTPPPTFERMGDFRLSSRPPVAQRTFAFPPSANLSDAFIEHYLITISESPVDLALYVGAYPHAPRNLLRTETFFWITLLFLSLNPFTYFSHKLPTYRQLMLKELDILSQKKVVFFQQKPSLSICNLEGKPQKKLTNNDFSK